MDFDREYELESEGIDAFDFSLMADGEKADFIIVYPKKSPFLYLPRPDDKETTLIPLPGGSGRLYKAARSIASFRGFFKT